MVSGDMAVRMGKVLATPWVGVQNVSLASIVVQPEKHFFNCYFLV